MKTKLLSHEAVVLFRELQLPAFREATWSLGRWGLQVNFGHYINSENWLVVGVTKGVSLKGVTCSRCHHTDLQ